MNERSRPGELTPGLTPGGPRRWRNPERTTSGIRRTATVLQTITELANDERIRLLDERPELEEELLTPGDVMRVLRIGRSRYQELVSSGELPSIKPGRIRLVPASEVRAYIRRTVRRV
jgi:excisionase family DNA binding protein